MSQHVPPQSLWSQWTRLQSPSFSDVFSLIFEHSLACLIFLSVTVKATKQYNLWELFSWVCGERMRAVKISLKWSVSYITKFYENKIHYSSLHIINCSYTEQGRIWAGESLSLFHNTLMSLSRKDSPGLHYLLKAPLLLIGHWPLSFNTWILERTQSSPSKQISDFRFLDLKEIMCSFIYRS